MDDKRDERVWLITGCSSGFGRELADVLLARGARVAATARDASRVAGLVAGHGERGLAIGLDVTDQEQVTRAVREVEHKFGRIDVLVNNAGRGILGAIEEAADAEVRAAFELNVFGLMAATREVLPGMRQRRSGAIVNVTSVGGLVGRAGSGVYAGTKFAVEGMSQALAQELAPLGIKVMCVEPGPFRTRFMTVIDRAATRIDDYAATAGARIDQLLAGDGRQPGDPRRAAEAIIDALDAETTPMHLVLGAPGLRVVREALDRFREELDTWESVSLGADFPNGSR